MRKQKKINLEYMTAVCGGPLTLKDINREVRHYVLNSSKRVVIDVRFFPDGKYYTSIYIPNRDFKNVRTGK